MKKIQIYISAFLFLISFYSTWLSAETGSEFFKDLKAKVADAEKKEERVLVSRDNWLFFMGELRSISVGPFWGDAAKKVSRASKSKFADPLPAILEFKKQCDKAGADLILVPVPAKAFIYADQISDAVKPGPDGKLPRLDIQHQKFYDILKEKGVDVLDLTDLFLEKRFDKAGNMYCMHDTHWSSRACLLTARTIKEKIKNKQWFKTTPRKKVVSEEKSLEIKGDLWGYIKDRKPETEKLPMIYAGTKDPGGKSLKLLKKERNSPIVLIGDSHTLIFNAGGDLHTRGAGLADHLALECGFGIDHIGVRGSGVTVPRIELARRRDNLKGKKLIIWCFSSRQFTESVNGWMTRIPVVK